MPEVCPSWQSASHHAPLSLLQDYLNLMDQRIRSHMLPWLKFCSEFALSTQVKDFAQSCPRLHHISYTVSIFLVSLCDLVIASTRHLSFALPCTNVSSLYNSLISLSWIIFEASGNISASSQNTSSAPQLPEYYSFALIRYFSLHNYSLFLKTDNDKTLCYMPTLPNLLRDPCRFNLQQA